MRRLDNEHSGSGGDVLLHESGGLGKGLKKFQPGSIFPE